MMTKVQGIPCHYEQLGTEGEHVLLLHGWGKEVSMDKHLRPLALLLQDSCQVTMLDFPAHGESGKPEGTWGVPEFAGFLSAFMAQLQLPPLTVVAHSFGGRVALWLASHEPQRVKRLVLTGAAGLRRPQTARQRLSSLCYKGLQGLLTGLSHLPLAGAKVKGLQKQLRDRRSSPDYLACDEDIKPSFVRIVGQDLRPLLPLISQPSLLIWGDRDEATPLWMGQEMQRSIPDAALITFEGRGHFAYLEELPRFASIVKAFIVEDEKQRV